jgi:hypothetical protein
MTIFRCDGARLVRSGRLLAVGLMALACFARPAMAGEMVTLHVQLTGGDLYDLCVDKPGDETQMLNNHICAGYLSGAQDAVDMMTLYLKGRPEYCVPGDTKRGVLLNIFRDYVKMHPEDRERPGAAVMVIAYRGAFPCPKAK